MEAPTFLQRELVNARPTVSQVENHARRESKEEAMHHDWGKVRLTLFLRATASTTEASNE